MALCLVITSILPNAAFAATATNTSHKVTLKNSEKGKLAFYPENKEIKDETERSYEPGENAFLSISPEKGYILSDIVIKSDKKEVKADLFTVEEKEDVLGIESIENDSNVSDKEKSSKSIVTPPIYRSLIAGVIGRVV